MIHNLRRHATYSVYHVVYTEKKLGWLNQHMSQVKVSDEAVSTAEIATECALLRRPEDCNADEQDSDAEIGDAELEGDDEAGGEEDED